MNICYHFIVKDLTHDLQVDKDDGEEGIHQETGAKFVCPNCNEISRDDVAFLCNTCGQEELILRDGLYICPSCLTPGENFECMLCGSKEVIMELKAGN